MSTTLPFISPKDIRKILVVRTDRIGDVVLTLPALTSLRKNLPGAKISLLVTPQIRDLIQGHPAIDQIFIDDRLNCHKGIRGFWSLVSMIRNQKFDTAINYHTKKRTNALCFFAGIPRRVGYKNNKWGFFLTHPVEDVRSKGEKHEAQYCLDVLRVFGIEENLFPPTLPVQESSEQWASQFFMKLHPNINQKIICLHPGASDPSKRWPTHRFAELINLLCEKYDCRFLSVGIKQDKKLVQEIQKLCRNQIVDVSGETSLPQLASILKRCHVLVSNDSGPVHVASAVGTPVVSIFTRNQPGINPERWKPLHPNSQIIFPPKSYSQSFRKANSASVSQLELIDSQEVLQAIDAIFKLC